MIQVNVPSVSTGIQSADVMLQTSDVDLDVLKNCRVFHFGSVSMTTDPSRTATLDAAGMAKRHGAMITFAPNLRLSLWETLEEAKNQVLNAMKYADVLKVSDEELTFLTGETSIETGVRLLQDYHRISVILVTRGADGCYFSAPCGDGMVSSFPVCTVDTTGAGDSFMGTFIAGILDQRKELDELSHAEITNIIRVANASGALTTTRTGGIPALPTRKEIIDFITSQCNGDSLLR